MLIKLTLSGRQLITNWLSTQALFILVPQSNRIKSKQTCDTLQISNGRTSNNRIEQREREIFYVLRMYVTCKSYNNRYSELNIF